ncbi:MAG: hypothetical protein QXS48_01805 [Candidatus Aenigmatarchaeota archaeon]
MKEKILIAIIFLLFIPSAKALSFGSLQKGNYAEMVKGETKEFTLLFWNLENSPCLVTLEPFSQESFVVIVEPKEFLLNASKIGPPYEEGEYVKLSVGDVKAFPVKVLIKALDSAKGENEIRIKTRAESLDSGIKVAQEKTFVFKIKILEHFSSEQEKREVEQKEKSKQVSEEEKISSRISLPSFDLRFTILASAIALILLISFLIYKFL